MLTMLGAIHPKISKVFEMSETIPLFVGTTVPETLMAMDIESLWESQINPNAFGCLMSMLSAIDAQGALP